MAKGDWKTIPFGCFMEVGNVVDVRRLKIMDVSALCSGNDGYKVVYTIPRNHYLEGTYLNGKCFILLYDGELKIYQLKLAAQNERDRAVYITYNDIEQSTVADITKLGSCN
ncbi:hypothetical protein [Vibrio parahaemolyticus]|uniref:hypothetical protein n=1 Tax=Vibrio parahaemolyticus TaxID=670 RepID=UPI00235DF145|nr:hypothetical protein [Vibrio parahaemolyticus]